MKLISESFEIGAIVSSLLILSYTTAIIGGNYLCKNKFNDWKVLGTLGSIGSYLGAYYVKND